MSRGESPEQIEREIDHTRADLARTLDALQSKLSPDGLLGQVIRDPRVGTLMRSAGSGGAQLAGGLGRTVRKHPLPMLVTGAGLVWLVVSATRSNGPKAAEESIEPAIPAEPLSATAPRPVREATIAAEPSPVSAGPVGSAAAGTASHASVREVRRDPHRVAPDEPSTAGGYPQDPGVYPPGSGGPAAQARERVRAAADAAKQRAAGLSRKAGRLRRLAGERLERMSGAVEQGGSGAYRRTVGAAQQTRAAIRSGARSAGSYVTSGMDDMGNYMRDNPVVFGAVALGLGAVMAMLLPTSRREHEVLGEKSDALKAAARDMAVETADKARVAVKDAAEAAVDAAHAGIDAARKEAKSRVRGGEGAPPSSGSQGSASGGAVDAALDPSTPTTAKAPVSASNLPGDRATVSVREEKIGSGKA